MQCVFVKSKNFVSSLSSSDIGAYVKYERPDAKSRWHYGRALPGGNQGPPETQRWEIHSHEPPYIEVFPGFSLILPTFPSISQQIQQTKSVPYFSRNLPSRRFGHLLATGVSLARASHVKWGQPMKCRICTHLPVMLPVDVPIVERVDFVKKIRREYRGKQQEGVDIQRE